jgi:hypothetical protein
MVPETFFVVSKYTPCFSDSPVNRTPFSKLNSAGKSQQGNMLKAGPPQAIVCKPVASAVRCLDRK